MTDKPRTYRVVDLKPSAGQSSKPSELIQIRGHEKLSLNARRSITILWHNAHRQGIEYHKDYRIELDALVGTKHKGYDSVIAAIEALMTTIIVITKADGSETRVQFLAGNDISDPNRPAGTLTYSFDKRLIDVLHDSTIWGKISINELMALTSKYAVSLYEHIAQWTGLANKRYQVYELQEFRQLMGLGSKEYPLFGNFNQRVLKQAVREINALAPFNIAAVPIKTGKQVTHIRLSWWDKERAEQFAAWEELHRPKVGRKARISGQTEMVLEPSPSPARITRRSLLDDD